MKYENGQMTVRVGELLTVTQPMELKKKDSDEIIEIKEGEQSIVGFDGVLHYLEHGITQEFDPETTTFDGFSAYGMSLMLMAALDSYLRGRETIKPDDMLLVIQQTLINLGFDDDINEKEGDEKDEADEHQEH